MKLFIRKFPLQSITLNHILSGDTCEPISLSDFETYLEHKEYSVENLQFLVWFQDYRKRFFSLPPRFQALSPGSSSNGLSCPVRTVQRTTESKRQFSTVRSDQTHSHVPMTPLSPTLSRHSISTDFTATNLASISQPTTPLLSNHTPGAYSPTFNPPNVGNPRVTSAATLRPEELPFGAECQAVLATFIVPGSEKELNLTTDIREAILKDSAWNTHPDVFLPVYEVCYDTLSSVSLPHFLRISASNINFPKTVMYYTTGLVYLIISLIITLLIVLLVPTSTHNSSSIPPLPRLTSPTVSTYNATYTPTPASIGRAGLGVPLTYRDRAHALRNRNYKILKSENNGGGHGKNWGHNQRAWRLFAVPFFSLGIMQVYSAWHGFCSNVWGRGRVQLRPWELKVAFPKEQKTLSETWEREIRRERPPSTSSLGDELSSIRFREPGRSVQSLKEVFPEGSSSPADTSLASVTPYGKMSTSGGAFEPFRRKGYLDDRNHGHSTLEENSSIGKNVADDTEMNPSMLSLAYALGLPEGNTKCSTSSATSLSPSSSSNLRPNSSSSTEPQTKATWRSHSHSLLPSSTSHSLTNPIELDLGITLNSDSPIITPPPTLTMVSPSSLKTILTRYEPEISPITPKEIEEVGPRMFGPERMVLDHRIMESHKEVCRGMLRFGFVTTLAFTALVCGVPGRT
ncbi:hypothetical protein ABKN59_001691 [Abortiporus biennis]